MVDHINEIESDDTQISPQWGTQAPRGGKTVLNRVLKEGTKVPLFLGQTFINSLRDVGYDSTTSALCEHVDNAIQAGASEIRVYFNQRGKRGKYSIDALVYDNGRGMPANVLQVAMSFGGSMSYDNRKGIGRFGVGMKTAALSMAPAVELYSWTEPRAIYTMTLDVHDIGSKTNNLLELPEPQLIDAMPSHVARVLTKQMVYPKDQYLLSETEDDLLDALGTSGTIVFIPDCDRVTYKKSQTLADHATKEMGRIYRVQLSNSLKLYVNNRRVEVFDPTYWDLNARHTKVEGLQETRSRLIRPWTKIQVPIVEGSDETAPVAVRLYMLPIEDWYSLPRKVLKNDLRLFDDHTVSFMRNDREVFSGTVPALSGKRHGDNTWMRIQIDFTGDLDEAFGVAMNKQGVRPKKYALDIIREHIKDDVARVKDQTARLRSNYSTKKSGTGLSEAERRASEADAYQAKQLPSSPAPTTDEETRALEDNVRVLAVSLKREDETDDQAYERVSNSRFITTFKHDDYWPFYHLDYQLDKMILTINTAHPFYAKLYDPILKLGLNQAGDDDPVDPVSGEENSEVSEILVALQMMLFSLGRAQNLMTMGGDNEEKQKLFSDLCTEWSKSLETQLTMA